MRVFEVGDRVKQVASEDTDAWQDAVGTKGTVERGPDSDNDYTVLFDGTEFGQYANVVELRRASKPLKVGQRVEVKVDSADYATVSAGDRGTVTCVNDDDTYDVVMDNGDDWFFSRVNIRKVKAKDEPVTFTLTRRGVTYITDAIEAYTDPLEDDFSTYLEVNDVLIEATSG